jgi:hypothetical protein
LDLLSFFSSYTFNFKTITKFALFVKERDANEWKYYDYESKALLQRGGAAIPAQCRCVLIVGLETG